MYIVELTFKQPLDVVNQYKEDHGEYLDLYYAKGNFIASGPQNPRIGGIIVAKANGKGAMKSIVEADPFVIHGVVDYRIIEFEPTKKQSWVDVSL